MSAPVRRRGGRTWLIWLLVVTGLLLFAGANAHLLYVAFESQPECVVQEKAPGEGGYRAARPAC